MGEEQAGSRRHGPHGAAIWYGQASLAEQEEGGQWIKKRGCCNTASESGGDLRGQQFTEMSPTDYPSKSPATMPPDPER